MKNVPEDFSVSLGMVVWGQVRGHPWWPARVSINEKIKEWRDKGKVWVAFFNDGSCAWLRMSEMRPFDSWFKSECQRLNDARRRFAKYKEKINFAISLAEEYITMLPVNGFSPEDMEMWERKKKNKNDLKKRPIKIRVKAPTLPISSLTARERQREGKPSQLERQSELSPETEATGRSRRVRVTTFPRRTRRTPSVGPEKLHDVAKGRAQEVHPDVAVWNDRRSGDEEGAAGHLKRPSSLVDENPAERPRRKRRRSARFGGGEVEVAKNIERRGFLGSLSLNDPVYESGPDEGSNVHDAERSGAFKRARLSPEETAAMIVPRRDASKIEDPVRRADYCERLKTLQDASITARLSNSFRDMDACVRRDGPTAGRSHGAASDPNFKVAKGLGRHARLTRGKQRASEDDATESENDERGMNGAGYSSRAVGVPEAGLQPGREGLMYVSAEQWKSVLKRIATLEKNQRSIQYKIAVEEEAKLGEDATAAGLKTAVRALAASAAAFVRKRGDKIDVLGRAVDLLWTDQDANVTPDLGLLRSVTKALVFAECKRQSRRPQFGNPVGTELVPGSSENGTRKGFFL